MNLLNQYTSRTVPSFLDIIGTAANSSTVTVNGLPTSRKGNYYRAELPLTNSASALWQTITNTAVLAFGTNDMATNWTGNIFVPKTHEQFTFDADGNLISDGRWTNKWDAENHLVSMTSHASVPSGSRLALHFAYDYQGRRISKVVSNWIGSAWAKASEQRFAYDGWNLIAVLDGNNALQMSFRWGTDLSGSMQGAGGVGGLISMTVHTGSSTGVYFFAFDGNGNVAGLVNAANATLAAVYEYDPFGRVLRATGPLASLNPFRFSTKWQGNETGFLYYGYRYYDPATGRWLSRDPIEERADRNLYMFVLNNPAAVFDAKGMASRVQHLDYNGTTVDVTADASVLFPCMGGPIYFSVHFDINEDNQGMHYLDTLVTTFYDDSLPGPSNGTVSTRSNSGDYPIEWDNFYQQPLVLCPKGQQQGSVTFTAVDPRNPGGLTIVFRWNYSCSCSCVEKDPFTISYEFTPTQPLNWANP